MGIASLKIQQLWLGLQPESRPGESDAIATALSGRGCALAAADPPAARREITHRRAHGAAARAYPRSKVIRRLRCGRRHRWRHRFNSSQSFELTAAVLACFLLAGKRFHTGLNRSVLSDVPAEATRVNRAGPDHKVVRLRATGPAWQYIDQAVFPCRGGRGQSFPLRLRVLTPAEEETGNDSPNTTSPKAAMIHGISLRSRLFIFPSPSARARPVEPHPSTADPVFHEAARPSLFRDLEG